MLTVNRKRRARLYKNTSSFTWTRTYWSDKLHHEFLFTATHVVWYRSHTPRPQHTHVYSLTHTVKRREVQARVAMGEQTLGCSLPKIKDNWVLTATTFIKPLTANTSHDSEQQEVTPPPAERGGLIMMLLPQVQTGGATQTLYWLSFPWSSLIISMEAHWRQTEITGMSLHHICQTLNQSGHFLAVKHYFHLTQPLKSFQWINVRRS